MERVDKILAHPEFRVYMRRIRGRNARVCSACMESSIVWMWQESDI